MGHMAATKFELNPQHAPALHPGPCAGQHLIPSDWECHHGLLDLLHTSNQSKLRAPESKSDEKPMRACGRCAEQSPLNMVALCAADANSYCVIINLNAAPLQALLRKRAARRLNFCTAAHHRLVGLGFKLEKPTCRCQQWPRQPQRRTAAFLATSFAWAQRRRPSTFLTLVHSSPCVTARVQQGSLVWRRQQRRQPPTRQQQPQSMQADHMWRTPWRKMDWTWAAAPPH